MILTKLSGVGFGVCHRLLIQLSYARPPDARPFFNVDSENATYGYPTQGIADEYTFDPDAGVTIIMACRDPKRAQDARTKLYALLDKHIAKLVWASEEEKYAKRFRQNARLELEVLDLSSVKSVLDFGKTVSQKYVPSSRSHLPPSRLFTKWFYLAGDSLPLIDLGMNTSHTSYSMPALQHTVIWTSPVSCSTFLDVQYSDFNTHVETSN